MNVFQSDDPTGHAGSGGRRIYARFNGEMTMKTIHSVAAMLVLLSAGAAQADSIPGMRGHDHTGVTVPNIVEGVDFFTNVIGCKKATSFGPFSDDKGTFMTDLAGVDSKAVIKEITLLRCGFGSNIELFEYTAPAS